MTSVDLSSSSLCAQKENRKDNDELTLVLIFSKCIETKGKETKMSVGSSSSSLGAHKEKKKR
jgi:hypothetical protein